MIMSVSFLFMKLRWDICRSQTGIPSIQFRFVTIQDFPAYFFQYSISKDSVGCISGFGTVLFHFELCGHKTAAAIEMIFDQADEFLLLPLI